MSTTSSGPDKKRVGILISGRGSNMVSLIEAARAGDYPAEIVCVISNRPEAAGLARAEALGIPTQAIDHKAFASREAFEVELDRALRGHSVEMVACAGFMRKMTAGFVEGWRDAMINIHPSLLPSYKGLHTHARALEDGVKIAGCTVHFVRPELDSGPIIAQVAVPVLDGDSEDSLAARILEAEHRLYPHALAMVASGAAKVEGDRVAYRQFQINQMNSLYWPPLD
ncbi:phosphoribosylglycinamide formyltransferase 1 [Hyphomicrobium sp. 1Nfss2.1]|uniref:phosphoribosylglycinamide formyltransferase n=1 Tax=Hyphomicrobium sp. 1Nfss2.1 TaxID=3413936 RepID=UPI003C7BC387